jgi:hypothetical protein
MFHDDPPPEPSHVEPFRPVFHRVAQGGEEPDLARLGPHELVGAVRGAVAVEHGQIAAIFPVRRVFHPEGDDVVEEGGLIQFPKPGDLGFFHVRACFSRVDEVNHTPEIPRGRLLRECITDWGISQEVL